MAKTFPPEWYAHQAARRKAKNRGQRSEINQRARESSYLKSSIDYFNRKVKGEDSPSRLKAARLELRSTMRGALTGAAKNKQVADIIKGLGIIKGKGALGATAKKSGGSSKSFSENKAYLEKMGFKEKKRGSVSYFNKGDIQVAHNGTGGWFVSNKWGRK